VRLRLVSHIVQPPGIVGSEEPFGYATPSITQPSKQCPAKQMLLVQA